MFISPAFAQSADAAAGGLAGIGQFLPLVLIFVVFYFLLIRPQQKRMKAHKEMLSAVRRGDKVVTNGGMIGTVTKVEDAEVTVEIADNVKVKVVRDAIASIISKTEAPKDKEEATAPTNDNGGKASGLKGLLSGKK